jgi:hypothetical protein
MASPYGKATDDKSRRLNALLAKPALTPAEAKEAQGLLDELQSQYGPVGDPSNPPQQVINQAAAAGRQQAARTQAVDQVTQDARTNQAENKAFVDKNVVPAYNQQRNAVGAANYLDQTALGNQQAARNQANATSSGLVNEQRANTAAYNAAGTQAFNNYSTQQQALNAQDQGALANYYNQTNPLMSQMQARGSSPQDIANQNAALSRATGIANGSLNYNAASYASNPVDVARQQSQYSNLAGVGNGSLDYAAQRYYTNQADLDRQQQGYWDLSDVGKGKLNYDSQGAKSYADAGDLFDQREALKDVQNEVRNGGRRQQEAYDTIKSRTGVEQTAQERLLYELNRRSAEAQNQSSRGAVEANMAARGILSGAGELASMQQSGQQIAQDRLLGDMSANAGAVQRAKDYTGMQSGLATDMRNSQQNALGMQGNLSTALRNQSFAEAIARGQSADEASRANQGTQLAGVQGSAATATAMRNASDAVGTFNTGQTNQSRANNQGTRLAGYQGAASTANTMRGQSDAVGLANTGWKNQAYANNQSTQFGGAQLQANQSNQIRNSNDAISMYQDTYKQNEATRVGNLANQQVGNSLGTTNQVGARNNTTYQSGVDVNNTNYGRTKDNVTVADNANTQNYGRNTDVNNMIGATGQRAVDRQAGLVNSGNAVASTRSGVSSADNDRLVQSLKLSLGNQVYDDDEHALGGY